MKNANKAGNNCLRFSPKGVYVSDIGCINFSQNGTAVISTLGSFSIVSYTVVGSKIVFVGDRLCSFAHYDACRDAVFYLGYEYTDSFNFFAA